MVHFGHMKNIQKGSVILWATVIIAILILGTGSYLYFKNNPTKTLSVQNCGEIINAPASDTIQHQKNIAVDTCISRAIATCSPSIIVEPFASGPGKKTFEILPKSGSYCPVSQTIDLPVSKMTCNIPLDFITAMNQFLQTKNQSSMLFYAIPLLFVPTSTPTSSRPIVKNPLTGLTVTVQCIDN